MYFSITYRSTLSFKQFKLEYKLHYVICDGLTISTKNYQIRGIKTVDEQKIIIHLTHVLLGVGVMLT